MSLGKLFGGGNKKKSPEQSIQEIKVARETLEKKQDFLEKKIAQEVKVAKENATKNKRVAINALKKKKQLMERQNQLDGILSNLDLLQDQLEQAHMNAQVTGAMHNAASTLSQINKANKLDKIDDMMDDIEDQLHTGENINEALSRQVGFGQDVDEDDLENELNDLMQEDLDAELLDVPEPGISLPSVPSTKMPATASKQPQVEDDDDDLRELQAWAQPS